MINKDMTNEDYHKHPAISSSQLKSILTSPALFKYRQENKDEPSDGMKLGSALHTWFLEPDRFRLEYVIDEKKSKGETVTYLQHPEGDITPALYKKFVCMCKALTESKEAQAILADKIMAEASFFTDYNQVEIKCRPDLIIKGGWIVDLKTVSGMDDHPSAPAGFCRDFFDRKYDLQMFMYKNIVERVTGKKFKGFKFIVVDAKEPVAGVNIYTFVDGESKWFEIGGHRFHEAMELYKKCKETGNYYVYENPNNIDLELSYDASNYYATVCEGK